MSNMGKILLADDERTFLDSTADLLRREGYDCDCVENADLAIRHLSENSYDLLIADIKMPGNPNLELIQKLPELSQGTSAILVTAFPSQNSAIDSVHLPVSAYMVKPIDFDELKINVAAAIKRKKVYMTVSQTRNRLQRWRQDIESIEEILANKDSFSASIKSFLDLTMGNISAAFIDIKNLTQILSEENTDLPVCNLMNCPKLEQMTKGILETVGILEKTKSSFKSKELGVLRTKLEDILKKNKKI